MRADGGGGGGGGEEAFVHSILAHIFRWEHSLRRGFWYGYGIMGLQIFLYGIFYTGIKIR